MIKWKAKREGGVWWHLGYLGTVQVASVCKIRPSGYQVTCYIDRFKDKHFFDLPDKSQAKKCAEQYIQSWLDERGLK